MFHCHLEKIALYFVTAKKGNRSTGGLIMQANFCEECGERLEPGAKFCENCGCKIEQEVGEGEAKKKLEPIQESKMEETKKTENHTQQLKNASEVKKGKPEKKKHNIFKVFFALGAIVVLCMVVWKVMPIEKEKASDGEKDKTSISDGRNKNNTSSDISDVEIIGTVGNTGGNAVNLGFALSIGNKVIYCNDLGIGGGGDTLITNMDGTDVKQFLGESCMTMDYDGEWVYYSHYLYDKGVFKIKPDKSEKARIADDEVAYLRVVGDWVYYFDSDFLLHRMKKDGSLNTVISDTPGEFINVDGEKIYYIEGAGEDGTIYQMNNDGTQKEQLLADKATKLIYHEGWLYYINISDGNKVYRVRTDGTGKEKILDEFCNSINIDKEWIYYTPYASNGLYRIKFDGTEKRTFAENEECYIFNIVGDKVYFVVFENDEDKVYIMPK